MHVVASASVKGGCGKSMVATNIALELQRRGLRVGILDADLDSPYLVEMAGITGKVGLNDDRQMVPVNHHGIPVMSFALWVPQKYVGASMSGDMHEQWIRDALTHTDWGDTDILIVDLPAGLRDEYLALKRVTGSDLVGLIAVCTPNVVSGLERVYTAATHHHMRILGVVENMSGEVFGEGTVQSFCKAKGLRFLGRVPLDQRVRQAHEKGQPELPEDLRQPIQRATDSILEAIA